MIDFGNTKSERRERVFQMLFSVDFNKDRTSEETFLSFYDKDDTVPEVGYIRDSFIGACAFSAEADAMIETDSKNWSTLRMSGVTKTILRLAIYELIHTDVPPRVVLNEALELSKKFGGDQEPSFVNGILNRIAKENGRL